MEQQAQYWMWTKRRHDDDRHHVFPSWEEQAFAEDAAGVLGTGCIWPPRSYSCTFCKREFRSAQALGGHMNVHRRDRARLKQSQTTEPDLPPQHNNSSSSILINPLEIQYQPMACTNFVFSPNLDIDQKVVASASYSSPAVRVSSAPATRSVAASDDDENIRFSKSGIFAAALPPKSNMTSTAVKQPYVSSDMKDPAAAVESRSPAARANYRKGEAVKADLAISLNLFICRNPSKNVSDDDDDEVVAGRCKRRRLDAATAFSFFPDDDAHQDSSVIIPDDEVVMSSICCVDENIDLELRLGDPPNKG